MDLKHTILTSLLVFALASTRVFAGEGGGTSGGGGGSIASQFQAIAKRTGTALDLICLDKRSSRDICRNLGVFKKAYEGNTNVIALEPFFGFDGNLEDLVLGPDGKPREAINNGLNEIQLSKLRWGKIPYSTAGNTRKVRLVVHEYFGTLKLESSDDYHLSNQVIDLLNQNQIDMNILATGSPYTIEKITKRLEYIDSREWAESPWQKGGYLDKCLKEQKLDFDCYREAGCKVIKERAQKKALNQCAESGIFKNCRILKTKQDQGSIINGAMYSVSCPTSVTYEGEIETVNLGD